MENCLYSFPFLQDNWGSGLRAAVQGRYSSFKLDLDRL